MSGGPHGFAGSRGRGRHALPPWLATALALAACNGAIAEPDTTGQEPGSPGDRPDPGRPRAPGVTPPASGGEATKPAPGAPMPPVPPPPAGRVEAPGSFRQAKGDAYRLLRLSTEQYRHAILDVLGVSDVPIADLTKAAPADDSVSKKDLMDGYHKTAVAIAERATATGGIVDRLCGAATPDAACAKKLVERLGPLLFRRPLSPEEITPYAAVFTAGIELGAPEAVRQVLVAMLISPSFFFVVESPGPSPDRLPEEQIATRLSLLLWDSVPDLELLDAARAGGLRDKAALAQTVARMLASPKGKRFPARFFDGWLETSSILEVQKD